jgi:hypothetical protein
VKYQRTAHVRVVTIDSLIEKYGKPAFCKIDVEGYEYEALKGLSTPLLSLSFEYVLPATELAVHCIRRLLQLGQYEFNWSFGETMRFDLDSWVDGAAMINRLSSPPPGFRAGDVYARLVN